MEWGKRCEGKGVRSEEERTDREKIEGREGKGGCEAVRGSYETDEVKE